MGGQKRDTKLTNTTVPSLEGGRLTEALSPLQGARLRAAADGTPQLVLTPHLVLDASVSTELNS